MKKLETPIAKLGQYLNQNLDLAKIAFVVLLIFIPLYPKFPLLEVEKSTVRVRIDDVVVSAAILIWLLYQAKNKFPIIKAKIFKYFALYWLAGLISILSAILITKLINPKIAFLHLFRRIEYMALFFVAYDGFKSMKTNQLIKIIGTTFIGIYLYGMGQKYFGLPVVSTMNEEFSRGILLYLDKWTRISSTFAGHYDLATWLVIILPLLITFFIIEKRKILKLIFVLLSALGVHLLILTASRISFISYLIALTIALCLQKSFRWLVIILALSLFFGFQSKELNARLSSSLKFIPEMTQKITLKTHLQTTTPIPTAIPTTIPVPTSQAKGPETTAPRKKKILKEVRTWPKPEEIEAAAARSSNIRFKVEWPRAAKAFLKNPLLGTGFSSLGLATDNDYLRSLGETGILGSLALGLIILHLFGRMLFGLKQKKNLIFAGFIGALAGFLANAIFIDVFEASKVAFYFWLLLGAAYRLTTFPQPEKRQ